MARETCFGAPETLFAGSAGTFFAGSADTFFSGSAETFFYGSAGAFFSGSPCASAWAKEKTATNTPTVTNRIFMPARPLQPVYRNPGRTRIKLPGLPAC